MKVAVQRLALMLCWLAAPAFAADPAGFPQQVPGACASQSSGKTSASAGSKARAVTPGVKAE
mgnify:CR=1 FL=1